MSTAITKGLRQIALDSIQDPVARQALQWVSDFLQGSQVLGGGFQFREIEFQGAVTNEKIRHGLPFRPKDLIQTAVYGSGVPTWKYDLFDEEYVVVTTTGACTVRFFLGSYGVGG